MLRWLDFPQCAARIGREGGGLAIECPRHHQVSKLRATVSLARRRENPRHTSVRMSKDVNQNKIMEALNWVYDRAINGVPGTDSAIEIAESYSKRGGSKRTQANALVRWQNAKAGTSGFIAGLGGIITMPVAIPANLASVMYVQIRMIAAIAHIGGHDVRDDRVRTLVYACMAGNGAKEILKDVGIVVGTKFAQKTIERISGKTIIAINRKVGFRLLTKFGQKGAVNLGKAVPLAGGLVGLFIDSVTTNLIGNIAIDTFIAD